MTRQSEAPKTAAELIKDLISATVALTGYPEAHVRQFVEPAARYMLREYGGERLPKVTRSLPRKEILAASHAGTPKRQICRQYKIGFGTLKRLLAAEK